MAAEASPDLGNVQSPETYVGYERASGFLPAGGLVRDQPHVFQAAATLALTQWTLSGNWTVTAHQATLNMTGGRVLFRFHARDLHLVLRGPGSPGKPIRFRILVDGHPPGADHGADVDAQGQGTIDGQRLYQLVRQQGPDRRSQLRDRVHEPGRRGFLPSPSGELVRTARLQDTERFETVIPARPCRHSGVQP